MALKLLIADDNSDDARLVAYALKRVGYTVEWQCVEDETGFASALPGTDLVICDFSMPSFSPVRALEVIRERGLDIPLLLVSGGISPDRANRVVMLGAVGYLLKGQLGGLGEAVRTALAGRAAKPSG